MNIVILPIVILGCWLLYSIVAGFWHVWLLHRLRLTMLRDYQRNPDSFDSWDEFQQEMTARLNTMGYRRLPDFRLIGILVTILGAVSVGIGLFLQMGPGAVALYTGGFASAILGLLLTGFGMMLRTATNTPAQPAARN